MICIGIGENDWAKAVPKALSIAASNRDISFRMMDLASLRVTFSDDETIVLDKSGKVVVTHLAPSLLYFKPAAAIALQALEDQGTRALNTVSAMQAADDKTLTARLLARNRIPQVPTHVIPLTISAMLEAFEGMGGETVFKRSHGGQGRWVRLAKSSTDVESIYNEFLLEGSAAIVAQPCINEFIGKTIRVIVTDGQVLASALRQTSLDWRSNIHLGSSQELISLTNAEKELAVSATHALGLGHSGIDLIRTNNGTKVLEVNACPDFTSMRALSKVDIADRVIEKTLTAKSLQEGD